MGVEEGEGGLEEEEEEEEDLDLDLEEGNQAFKGDFLGVIFFLCFFCLFTFFDFSKIKTYNIGTYT